MSAEPQARVPSRSVVALIFAALMLFLPALGSAEGNEGQELDPIVEEAIAEALADKEVVGKGQRAVDVVICLDTSNSMDHLLDATRSRIWDIVHQLSRLEPSPSLRVGLLTYGSPRYSSENDGWVIQRSDLTEDLDTVFAELMDITTSGGDELVGRVIHEAVEGMSWSSDYDALRVIFVAGNESADQGVDSYDFRLAVEKAVAEDIIVNSLFVGGRELGADEKWHEVASLGAGNYSALDLGAKALQIATPQDEALLELNARLNSTYLPYGPRGEAGRLNQIAQDTNATRLGVESCSSRIVAKGTALYNNASWDLIDATLQEDFSWDNLSSDDLPEILRPMSRSERQAHIVDLRELREDVQQEIQLLSEQRETFLRGQRDAGRESLGQAMTQAILAQATAKGFACLNCES